MRLLKANLDSENEPAARAWEPTGRGQVSTQWRWKNAGTNMMMCLVAAALVAGVYALERFVDLLPRLVAAAVVAGIFLVLNHRNDRTTEQLAAARRVRSSDPWQRASKAERRLARALRNTMQLTKHISAFPTA